MDVKILSNIYQIQKISFVIPCYGSEKTIEHVVNDIFSILTAKEFDFEIILVNDNSPDNVWKKILILTERNKEIIGINLSKNFGQNIALMAGYAKTSGDVVVSLDDDGQTPPSEVFALIDKMEEGYDVVFAAYKKKHHSLFRNIGSKINDYMAEILINKPKELKMSSFFVSRKFVINEVVKYKGVYPYIGGLILRTTDNITNIQIEHRKRQEGKSGYTFSKLLSLWLNGFTAFSVKPLRIASVLGTCLASLSFLYIIYLVIKRIINPNIFLGYTSMMAGILFIGGVIMMMLGLLGEYIGRIYISINNASQYVIKEIVNKDN
jgi:undecaprenyl-phosphate 4-deoxy-4-formamido-L-arabinose transferase